MAALPSPRASSFLVVAGFLLLAASGCVGGPVAPGKPGAGPIGNADGPQGLRILGTVTDVELRPLPGVSVVVNPGALTTTSDANGSFAVGPVEVGTYEVTAEGAGFRAVTLKLEVAEGGANKIWITLTDPVGGTPYHETQIYVTYTFCATSSAPCAPINTVTSQNLTPDRPDLLWKIPGPGLANMKYEITWPPSLTSGDKSFTTRNPEGLFLACNATNNVATPTVLYFSGTGPSGFGIWIWPGKVNPGGCVKFEATDGKKYYTVNRPQSRNATIPVGLALDQKISNYLTFFYFLAGPDDFTAVPDQ
jgi:hypothetical protein